MSLHEVSDGLLETHVTWQDVESEMQQVLTTTATFGPNKKATNIGDMKGFMSKIALIDPDWVNPEGTTLPTKFAVKIFSQLSLVHVSKKMGTDVQKLIDKVDLAREAHNREVEAYKFLMKLNSPKIPFTKIYAMKSFDEKNKLKGFIISDFVPDAIHFGMHQSIASKDLEVVVKGLGTLSSSGEKYSKEETAFLAGPEFVELVFKSMLSGKELQKLIDKLRSAYPLEFQEEYSQFEKILTEVYSNPEIVKKYTTVSEYLGMKDVFCHCDPWSSNFLFNKEGDRLVLKAIIDWQLASKCNPALDICRNLVACLSAEERIAKKNHLLEVYYNAMLEELGENSLPLFTLQQLHDSYHLHIPFISLLVLPVVASMIQNPAIPEKDRPGVQKLALAKMTGLLEEILESHDYNIKKFPDFFNV